MRELDADGLMRGAEDRTGLSDWGRDFFLPPLLTLIHSLNTEANLNELGLRRAVRRLSDTMDSRLRRVADRKRHPAIAAEKIIAPIFVSGLPRSGTTFLHTLLSQDPVNRSPATWEIMYPSPPPGEEDFTEDPRIAAAAAAMEFEGFMAPDLQAIHPFDARRPEECNFLWEHSFLTPNYMAWWNVPSYTKLLYSVDFLPVYEEEREFLQHLQWHVRRDRWVLKSPAHMAWLGELFTVFPDACVIQCHRDPAKIVPSLAKNLAVWRKTFSDEVPSGGFGMLELQAAGLKRVSAFRADPRFKDRFADAHYLDVQRDPIGAVRRLYRQFGIDWSESRAGGLRAWLEANREDHAQGPRHTYSLEQFDLDLAKIDAVMGDYIRSCGVQLER
ncbi:MAG TPA: sulfotransferase [Steroidobacteraceae bacterium]|nr:sulfotransferase [Steroidobacteraceae bacterium]